LFVEGFVSTHNYPDNAAYYRAYDRTFWRITSYRTI
jgi:hypothetical protein